jgi:mannose-6-phosphate isomerase-like protein (cupin superfamily)
MLITNRDNTRKGNYEEFSTNLLVGELNSGSKEISIQISDIIPGGEQFLHRHEQEQCYYIISGTGLMLIDDEEAEVKAGDSVFIPSNANHGIRNIDKDTLTYLTANKAFGKEREKEIWNGE